MMRTLTSRRVASALNNAAAAGSLVRNAQKVAVRCMAGAETSMNTRRSYHSQSHYEEERSSRSSRVRSSSPSPASRSRPLSYQVQSPKPSQRSYGTSSPIMVEAAAAAVTHECSIRHLQDSFSDPPTRALYDPHYEEDAEHSYLTGYVASGAVETTFTTSTIINTDEDMDAIADDEEWLPAMQAPAAEQVLAMMDTSYYHASYRAKSHGKEENHGKQ